MRIDKPIGFFLLLWPTLWALWLSNQKIPDVFILVIFIFCVFLTRSFGCVINDCVDKNIDCYVQRTKHRPLSCGKVNIKESLILFFILVFISFIIIIMIDTKIQTMLLSLITLILICVYPYTKRYIFFPQLFLGVTFGCSPLLVFSILGVSLYGILPWLLFLINVIWTVIYDTEYAMVDRDDDILFNIQSSAVFLRNYERIFIGILQLIMLILLIFLGLIVKFGTLFYILLNGVLLLFIWQQMLIINCDRDKCFQAFLSNNYVGMLIFFGIFFEFLIF